MTPSQRVFVTGGSGVVGGAVVRCLVEDGREVRALGRSEQARTVVAALGAQPVAGDIQSPASLVEAMAGCETVFHAAGKNAFCVSDPSSLFAVNVIGSLNVVKAAASADVRRLVFTSSAATMGERRGTVGDEGSEHRGYFLSEYERSKYEAERVVLNTAREMGVDVVCVNPSSVQGPGRSGGTARFLVMYLRGKLRWLISTQLSIVDIDDCARGHLLAESNGKTGERYVLNSASLPIEDALDTVGRLTGNGSTARMLPGPLAGAAGAAVEIVFRALRKPPPVCRETVRTLRHGHTYDGSRAVRELGLEYTPVEVTLEKTIRWLRAEGLVPG